DRIGRNRPLALFGRREVIDADLVIRIAVSPGDDVDDDSRTEEPLDRYLIDRLRTPGKMQRGIQVRAAMLRGGEVVRRVIITARRNPICRLFETERIRGRPEDRRRVVGVREVDELSTRKARRRRRRSWRTTRQ